jgi:hypothetical protein
VSFFGVGTSLTALNASNLTSGTTAIARGGTGQGTQQTAINALAGAVTNAQYLRGNGTNVLMSAIQAADVPTLNQSTTGNAATATALQNARLIGGVSFNGTANINLPGVNTAGNQNTTGSAGSLVSGARTVTADTSQNYHSWQFRSNQTTASAIRILGSDGSFRGSYYGDGVSQGFLNSSNGWVVRFNNGELQSGTVPVGRITGTLPVANGGTGRTTLTANNVLLGNGTTAVNFVAPGTNGNVLQSNGTSWISAAPPAGVAVYQ